MMTKYRYMCIYVVCLFIGEGFAQEDKVEQTIKLKKEGRQNRVSKLGMIFRAYKEDKGGKMPSSWEDIESLYPDVWNKRNEWRDLKKRFVLLPEIGGHINSREDGPHEAKIIIISSASLSYGEGDIELGRWTLWENFRGQFVHRWHPEVEIRTFSNWEKVEDEIERHSKSYLDEKVQGEINMEPSNISQPKLPNTAKLPKKFSVAEPEPKPAFSLWAMIFGGIVLLGIVVTLVKRK